MRDLLREKSESFEQDGHALARKRALVPGADSSNEERAGKIIRL